MRLSSTLSDYRFPVSYVDTIVEAWKSCGLDERLLLEGADLYQRYPLPANTYVTGQDVVKLYHAGMRHYEATYPFSLKLAHHYNFTTVGLLGLAVVTAGNLCQVLELVQRYFPLFFPGARLSYQIEPARLQIRYELSSDYGAASPFLSEVVAGVVMRFTTYFKHAPKPVAVEFAHDEPAAAEAFSAYFRCPVSFNSATNSVQFSIDDLANTPTMAEPSTLAQLQKQLENALKKHEQETSWSERTRQAWTSQTVKGAPPSLDDVATFFNLTPRTLERRLQQESTSFSQIVQEQRVHIATELLRDRTLPIAEIAYQVGFQDATAFSRFFKQATGSTPAAFRADQSRPKR